MLNRWLWLVTLLATLVGCVPETYKPTNEEAAAALADYDKLSASSANRRPSAGFGAVLVAAGHEAGQLASKDPRNLKVPTVAVTSCQAGTDAAICSILVSTSGQLRRHEGVRFWRNQNGTWRMRFAPTG